MFYPIGHNQMKSCHTEWNILWSPLHLIKDYIPLDGTFEEVDDVPRTDEDAVGPLSLKIELHHALRISGMRTQWNTNMKKPWILRVTVKIVWNIRRYTLWSLKFMGIQMNRDSLLGLSEQIIFDLFCK